MEKCSASLIIPYSQRKASKPMNIIYIITRVTVIEKAELSK
jgi:hypothetical protein